MKRLKLNLYYFIAVFLFSLSSPLEAQDYDISQGEFAIQLVKVLKLQSYLPPAPLPYDYVNTLEVFGISPLKGWSPRKMLSEEDYIVVVSRLSGQEREVYKTAVEFCDKVVLTLREAWEDQYAKDGIYSSFDQLIQDPRYFAGEKPVCPFGMRYKSNEKNHKVSRHIHIQKSLTGLRFDK